VKEKLNLKKAIKTMMKIKKKISKSKMVDMEIIMM